MKNEMWNPWRDGPQRPTATSSDAERATARQNIDPIFSDICATDEATTEASPDPPILEMLENMRMHRGCDVPREKALSADDERRAMEEMAAPRRARVIKDVFPKLLASAEKFLPEDSVTTRFLRAVVAGDKNETRECVKLLDPIQ